MEDEVELIQAARDELIRQAAQGEVLHNDDTGMRVLRMARRDPPTTAPACSPPASCPHNEDAGSPCTSPAVSTPARICAMYSNTGAADHARPLQMCDALSRNTPKLSDGAVILLANCLVHGRRQFVEGRRELPRTLPLCSGGAGRRL